MASTSETGHAKNVANFQDLISFVTGYGTAYNPSKARLKIDGLNSLYATAQGNLTDVITKNTTYNNVVNERIAAFGSLKSLSTRLVNALDATDATPEKVKNADGFNRKLQGRRSSSTSNQETPIDLGTPAPATISVSQQSYDQLIQHFAGLISVLKSEPSYTPNENDLKVATLLTKQTDLISKNTSVTNAYTAVSNSRIVRDKTLYNTDTGLVDIAGEVKKYIKSVFGSTSPEYAQVKGLEFRKVKK